MYQSIVFISRPSSINFLFNFPLKSFKNTRMPLTGQSMISRHTPSIITPNIVIKNWFEPYHYSALMSRLMLTRSEPDDLLYIHFAALAADGFAQGAHRALLRLFLTSGCCCCCCYSARATRTRASFFSDLIGRPIIYCASHASPGFCAPELRIKLPNYYIEIIELLSNCLLHTPLLRILLWAPSYFSTW